MGLWLKVGMAALFGIWIVETFFILGRLWRIRPAEPLGGETNH